MVIHLLQISNMRPLFSGVQLSYNIRLDFSGMYYVAHSMGTLRIYYYTIVRGAITSFMISLSERASRTSLEGSLLIII